MTGGRGAAGGLLHTERTRVLEIDMRNPEIWVDVARSLSGAGRH